MTFEDSDRALIVETLEQIGWIVGGPRRAAAKLGLKRTACRNEKIGYLATYLSGRNRCSRTRARRCPDLRVQLAAAHGIKLVKGCCKTPILQFGLESQQFRGGGYSMASI
jgi:hypothetical protein